MPKPTIVLIVLLCLALCVWGCGESTTEPSGVHHGLVDLVASFEEWQIDLPTREIDIGQPEAWSSMVAGWHPMTRKLGGTDRLSNWTRGDRAALAFFVPEVRELQLTFRCNPAVPPEIKIRMILRVSEGVADIGEITLAWVEVAVHGLQDDDSGRGFGGRQQSAGHRA